MDAVEPARSHAAGDALLHPLPLAALALLIVNDHVLKARFGGPGAGGLITGKLSDIAGLVFFPLLLVALIELAQRALRRFSAPSRKVLFGAVLATGVVFGAVKTSEAAGDAYRIGWGALQWPYHAARAAMKGVSIPSRVRVKHVIDPTDLIALPSLLLAWRIGRQRSAARPQ